MKELKIRKLKISDRKRLSALISKLINKTGDDSIANIISSAVTETANKSDDSKQPMSHVQVGIKIMSTLLNVLEEETQDWFADLVGVKKEEFLELPIDSEVQIIEQIINAEESSSFFTTASRVYKKINVLKNKFVGAKEGSDTKKS